MNIGIEYGLTKLTNSSNADIANINALGDALVKNLNSNGLKTTVFNKVTEETNSKLTEEKLLSSINSLGIDFLISINFNKEDTTSNGAYIYALGEEETMISKNILSNLSSIFTNNGVRVGNNKSILKKSIAKSIILSPYNLVSESDIAKVNEVGIDAIAKNIAISIFNSIK